jgi:hypothetical protein
VSDAWLRHFTHGHAVVMQDSIEALLLILPAEMALNLAPFQVYQCSPVIHCDVIPGP